MRARSSWRDALRISEYVQGKICPCSTWETHWCALVHESQLCDCNNPHDYSCTSALTAVFATGAIDKFQPPGAAKRLRSNMEISVSKLQLPWAHW